MVDAARRLHHLIASGVLGCDELAFGKDEGAWDAPCLALLLVADVWARIVANDGLAGDAGLGDGAAALVIRWATPCTAYQRAGPAGQARAALDRAQPSMDHRLLELEHGPAALDRVLIAARTAVVLLKDAAAVLDGPWVAQFAGLHTLGPSCSPRRHVHRL